MELKEIKVLFPNVYTSIFLSFLFIPSSLVVRFSCCVMFTAKLLAPLDKFLLLIIPAVMFFQTVVSFSPYAGFVGGSLCDAEEELGTL